jgi:hypothetical protein
MVQESSSLQKRYDELTGDRSVFLERGRDSSVLTIPSLLPEEGHSSSTKFDTPYQSVGARGVNNLASKLLLTLLPANSPFARLIVDDSVLASLGADGRGEVEVGLAKIERMVMADIETKAIRVPVFEALKHLIVTGNALVYLDKGVGTMKVFRLDRYVVKRDAMGNVLEIITKESVDKKMLPNEVVALMPDLTDTEHKTLDLYTGVVLTSKGYEVHQEVMGIEIPKSRGVYKKGKLPFIPLRFIRIDGEDYGRGYIEEYIGDLISLEALSQAIVEGSAASAKVLFLVAPNGTTKASTLGRAANGAFVDGNANDVTTLQVQKAADFRVAESTSSKIEQRLAYAFLLNSAVQRNAERVTAEEVRYMAQELEAALGGIYSILSQEFQLPLVTLILESLQKEKKMPKLPKEIKPVIVTGVEALGRGQDLNKLATFLKYLQPLGPQVIQSELKVGDYIARLGASLGIDTFGLIKTEQEKMQEQEAALAQQQQMMQDQTMASMAERSAPELAKQMGNTEQINNG